MQTKDSQKLYDLMTGKGYPAAFAGVICHELHTEYAAGRMISYIARNPLLPPEEVADEMYAILNDRDRIIEKHIAEDAQKKLSEWYRSR